MTAAFRDYYETLGVPPRQLLGGRVGVGGGGRARGNEMGRIRPLLACVDLNLLTAATPGVRTRAIG